ncbi:hypothetical protein [Mucilaginibacter dorajii]|uniref:Lipocalin-like domain-containing protein n=1 Tax=Mucilaginibacter dorajii TaxID=692994 RepID=A0ABP7PHY9_9SPHI|nr:hypothetical protein [Mucilaginibacter dorajii]MCS3735397.1 hypothetical protein [Mucilaginibacter dorajii]
MKKLILPVLIVAVLCSFNNGDAPLKGVWEYRGGLFNGKIDTASAGYILQRTYDKQHYKAIVKEKGEANVIYEKGDYVLRGDTCFETQTYSLQPSNLLNKTVKYTYIISNDTLKLLSILPNGNKVEDHWVRIK